MKISALIAKMQALYEEHGDLDIACTTGGPALDPDEENMQPNHLLVVDINDQYTPSGIQAPYVLIGWSD